MTDFEWIEAVTAKARAACQPRGRGRLTQLNDITAALPVIVAEVLAPIEALHETRVVFDDAAMTTGRRECSCGIVVQAGDLDCPTAKAVAAIREAVRA